MTILVCQAVEVATVVVAIGIGVFWGIRAIRLDDRLQLVGGVVRVLDEMPCLIGDTGSLNATTVSKSTTVEQHEKADAWAKTQTSYVLSTIYIGRGGGIRTPDPLLPKQMRYQTALRPDMPDFWPVLVCSKTTGPMGRISLRL